MVLLQAPGEVSESAALTEGIRPEALDERQIEDLIAEHLQQHLEILPEQDLANALHEFVDKVPYPSWQALGTQLLPAEKLIVLCFMKGAVLVA